MNTNAEKRAPKETKELVHPDQDGFIESVTPKQADSESNVFMFECSNKKGLLKKKCGNIHYRHAGYVELLMPFIRPGNDKRVSLENHQVMVCTKCKACYIWINEQMYDITDRIDLKAWERTEKAMQKATGPGGEC